MRWGIESGTLDPNLPYAAAVTAAAVECDIPVALLYSIAWHESIQGEINGKWIAATVVSGDGGYGLCQLTSSWPDDWQDPQANARYACEVYIAPAAEYWVNRVSAPDDLVKCIGATYNAGLGSAVAGHQQGNVDLYTTDNYGAAIVDIYRNLINSGFPLGS